MYSFGERINFGVFQTKKKNWENNINWNVEGGKKQLLFIFCKQDNILFLLKSKKASNIAFF